MSAGPFGTGAFGTIEYSVSPLYTTKDIIDAVLRDTGHSAPESETVKRKVVLSFINNCYARVTTSRQWDWLFQHRDARLLAPYSTGTVTVTHGSETVTGLGTAFSANALPDNRIIIGDEIHTIAEVNSPTELVLESAYAGESASGLAFKIVKPIFQLPADCEHVNSLLIDGVGEVVPVGPQELRRKQQYDPTQTGAPRWFTEIARRAQDGVRSIEVWPAPDKSYSIHFDYGVNMMKLADSETSFPLIPDRHRVVLYYGALAEMYRYLSDPTNSESARLDFRTALLTMQNDTQITDSKLILQPARNYRSRRGRRLRVTMDRSDFSRHE